MVKITIGNLAVMVLLRKLISEFNVLPRARLARKYLKGNGIEIGAQASPLKVPSHVTVKYLDVIRHNEILQKFPELDPKKIVHVDFVSDGFSLNGIVDAQFDFLIANHVLEHSPNPIGALVQWNRVLKPGGKIFCSVPRLDKHFDKGRALTTWEHLYQDYTLYLEGAEVEICQRNMDHYMEWLLISEPAIIKKPALNRELIEKRSLKLSENKEEIHFHTFDKGLTQSVFYNLQKVGLLDLKVLTILQTRVEIIVVVEKPL